MSERKPEIRFVGYEDNWVEKRFVDVFDILSNNTLSRDSLNDESGCALNVHYGDVLIKFGEYLDVSREKLPFISDEDIAAKFKPSFLKDGDIIIADTAEDETVGKCTEIFNVGDLPVIPGLHTIPCRPRKQFAPIFMGYYLNSGRYRYQLIPLMQGVKVTSISRTGIKDTIVKFSKSASEQLEVANYMWHIDGKISAESDRYDRLCILRKSLLDKIFPREGRIPELRFSEYIGEWEELSFGEIITRKMSNGIINRFSEDESPVRHINVINMYSPDRIHVEELTYSKHDLEAVQKCNVEVGDIFLTRSSVKPEGIAEANVLLDPGHFVFDDHLIQMKLKKSYVPMFVKILLGTCPVKKQFIIKSKTTAFTTIGQNDISESIGLFPSYEEQVKIAQLFMCIDKKIDLQLKKIKKLQNIKSACMKKMFV